jgi:ribosome-associated toxin RatA of RatAB toxin-antitoxin module
MLVQRSLLMPYSTSAMFDVIEQAEHYPRFIPWCTHAQILERTDDVVAAILTMRVAGLSLSLETRNPKRRPHWLTLRMVRGPLRRFTGQWNLTELGADACRIEFTLDYEVGDPLVQRIAGPWFARMADTMVDAYVVRAEHLRSRRQLDDRSGSLPTPAQPAGAMPAAHEPAAPSAAAVLQAQEAIAPQATAGPPAHEAAAPAADAVPGAHESTAPASSP